MTVALIAGSSLVRTKLCLESLLLNTEYPHYDVTVLIAGRANRTWEYMRHISRLYPHVRAQPASEAADVPWRDGSYLAVLDAGTIVHPGWLSRLVHHLERTGAGIATPESDEMHDLEGARALRPYGELQVLALDRARAYADQTIEIADASLHCGVVRRQVCEQLGLPFRCRPGGVEGIRDYTVRAREAGYVLVRAPDVLVHRLSPPAGGEATSRNDMQARREGVGAAAPVSAREVQGHQ